MSFFNSIFSIKEQVPADTSRQTLREILETTRESVLVVGEDTRIVAKAPAYDALPRQNCNLEKTTEQSADLNLHEAFPKPRGI